ISANMKLEYQFHRWLADRTRQNNDDDTGVFLSIGDDAAVVSSRGRKQVLTTDSLAEGIHFLTSEHSLERIGHKSMAASLSDLAAMGARPEFGLVSFFLPTEFDLAQTQQLFVAMEETAELYGVSIVGGDTNCWEQGLVIHVTLIGSLKDSQLAWVKSGATPGDRILVTGEFGGSLDGKHLDFEPRVKMANHLRDHYPVKAATDVTDSLSLDLASMADASNVTLQIDAGRIPLSNSIADFEEFTAIHHALVDGEDFELILSVSPSVAEQILKDPSIDVPVTEIGVVIPKGTDSILLDQNGTVSPFQPQGYIH
ncbi:MAG: thiamine-phosphate kinase, partial [Planctomycetota bacterium]